jgi:pyruvate/2-oxoglutarate dehydrogenase complex dihydrolipoamide acyltransferase (E2) component
MLESDVSRLLDIRKDLNERAEREYGLKVSIAHLLVKITAAALQENPIINAELDLDTQEIVFHSEINVGVAMNTPEGLMVPVIKAANKKSIFDIAQSYRDLAEKSAKGTLSIEDASEGTFTVSSLHEFGIENGLAIINPPQSAILFLGTYIKKPVVVNDEIVIRPVMWVSLTYDHRIIDGVAAATFTSKVKSLIENPEQVTWE